MMLFRRLFPFPGNTLFIFSDSNLKHDANFGFCVENNFALTGTLITIGRIYNYILNKILLNRFKPFVSNQKELEENRFWSSAEIILILGFTAAISNEILLPTLCVIIEQMIYSKFISAVSLPQYALKDTKYLKRQFIARVA